MERVIGGVLALACFIAVVAASALRGLGVWDAIWRGLIGAALGFLAGWLLFGRIGLELAKEAVQGAEAPSEKPLSAEAPEERRRTPEPPAPAPPPAKT